ncbi:MAG: hypothetical protein JO050_02025, partial [Acidimicrobiia bacterium]|nr:hypothetical protein [Acidimicrobiia bacterium]
MSGPMGRRIALASVAVLALACAGGGAATAVVQPSACVVTISRFAFR